MLRNGFVDTPNGQIRYVESGQGHPLSLVHATSDASSMWEPVLPRFGALGYRAVAIDLPGHGVSYRPATAPGPQGYASAIKAVADGLGIRRAALLGHHFGGLIAAQAAAEWPAVFDRLAIYGWGRNDAAARKKRMEAGPRAFARDGEDLHKHWLHRWNMSGMLLDDASQNRFNEEIAVRAMIAYLQAGPNWYWAYHAMGETDPLALAARVSCPVLLFAGPRDHYWRESQAAVGDFPDAKFVAMPWVGPDAADEEPGAFCAVVHDFLSARR